MEKKEQYILVVEDDKLHADLIQRAFDSYDDRWRLEVVGSLKEARKSLKANPPDLTIVDLILPDGQGTGLLQEGQKEQEYPIVVLTGHGDERIAVDAMKSGAFDYVVKSAGSMAVLPRIATHVLREWGLVLDRRAAERSLKESEERYRMLVEDIPFMICRYLPMGELTFVNSQFCEFYDKSKNELIGHNLFDILTEDCARFVQENFSALSPSQPVNSCECPIRSAVGEICWLRWTNRGHFNRDGYIVEYQSVVEDITERKQIEQKLHELATHDTLTGLPNRRLFQDRLHLALSRAKRYDQVFALLFLDLDGFKSVNDSRGHDVGDKVLQAVARRLQSCVREMDTVGRLGGDEFGIIVEQPHSLTDVIVVIQRIIDCFSRSFEVNDHKVSLTISIGVGIFPHDASDSDGLIRKADRAMYLAKNNRKNQYYMSDIEEWNG